MVGLNGVIEAGMDEIAHVEELDFEFLEFDRNRNLKPAEWLPYIISNAVKKNKRISDIDNKQFTAWQRERLDQGGAVEDDQGVAQGASADSLAQVVPDRDVVVSAPNDESTPTIRCRVFPRGS